MRICVAERNVTSRQSRAGGGRKGENDTIARAVINARGLEQKSIGRIEHSWENLCRGEIARQVDIGKRSDEDKRGGQQ